MFCRKCGVPHGLLNKIEGLRHLEKVKQGGRLENIELEKFNVVSSRQEIREIVMDSKRKNTLFVRTGTHEGDETHERWFEQPRWKFPSLANVDEKQAKQHLETFFHRIDNYNEKFWQDATKNKSDSLLYLAC